MARPERNSVDYFPFYCEDGKKMFYIEETYGNDGFATFLKILRELAKTDYHYLDLSKNTTLMFLSAKCKISKDLLLNIINDLVELGKFNEMLWNESRIIWCQDFIDSVQDAYKKRNNDCITLEGLLFLLNGLGIRKLSLDETTIPVKPQRKEKDIKEDKIKEEDIKENDLTVPDHHFEIRDKIMSFFKFNEIANFDKLRDISAFLRCIEIAGKTKYFSEQLDSYIEYKTINDSYIHKFKNFIGASDKLYTDGAWNDENWTEKLKTEKLNQNGRNAKKANGGSRSNQGFDNSNGYSDL